MLRQQEHHRDHSHHHYHYEGREQEELHGASNTPLLSPTQRLSKTSLPARSKLVTTREPRPRIARLWPQQRGLPPTAPVQTSQDRRRGGGPYHGVLRIGPGLCGLPRIHLLSTTVNRVGYFRG